MSELAYWKLLSLALYIIISILFYQKISDGIVKDEDKSIADMVGKSGLDPKEGFSIVKTATFVFCIFWPVGVISSALRKKKKQ